MLKICDKRYLYKKIVSKCEHFDLKGKSILYTSVNGHMFSQMNKDGELGIRFSDDVQQIYMKELQTDYFKSYGSVMKGYVLMPEEIWDNLDVLLDYLMESYTYVSSLKAK